MAVALQFGEQDRRSELSPRETHDTATRLRSAAVYSVLTSCVVGALLLLQSNIQLDPSGTYVLDWLLAAVLLVSRVWWGRAGHNRISDLLGTCAVAAFAGMACGAVAMISLPLHYPLADNTFLTLDRAIGFNVIQMVTKLAALGPNIFSITWPPYNYTLQLFFLSLVVLSVSGNRLEAWRAALCFSATLLTVCVIAIFVPAKGVGVWGTPEFFEMLPDSAMRGFWAHFDEFYEGAEPVLRLRGIDGVISFPSFHTIVGLIVVSMWRKNVLTLIIAFTWFALMMPGTLFYGGHYIVDLLSGFFVWLFWFKLSRRLEVGKSAMAEAVWPEDAKFVPQA